MEEEVGQVAAGKRPRERIGRGATKGCCAGQGGVACGFAHGEGGEGAFFVRG